MRKLFKIILLAACVAVFIIYAQADGEGYEITNYQIHVNVGEDNSLTVTETIDVHFTVPQPGITRNISRFTKNGNKIEIKDVDVPGNKYTKSTDDKYLILTIGNKNENAAEYVTYVIQYTCLMGYDKSDGADWLYVTLANSQWSSGTPQFEFTITMPKQFDEKELAFYSGYYGKMNDRVEYSVSGTTISGRVPDGLKANESFTAELMLPDGYFSQVVNTRPQAGLISWICLLILAFLCGGSVLLWHFQCRNRKLDIKTHPHPPEGCNPADSGYILSGGTGGRRMLGLLLHWASKGYVSFDFGENIMVIRRMNMGNECKDYEQRLFSALFENDGTLLLSDRDNRLYEAMKQAKAGLRGYWRGESQISMPQGKRAIGTISVFAWLSFGFSSVSAVNGIFQDSTSVIWVVPAFLLGMLLSIPLQALGRRLFAGFDGKAGLNVRNRVVLAAAALGICWLILNQLGLSALDSLCLVIAGLLSLFAGWCRGKGPRKTEFGCHMAEQVLGLRSFILNPEPERLTVLNKENSQYFYSILPYAVSLGVMDQWAESCKELSLEPPDWLNDPSPDREYRALRVLKLTERLLAQLELAFSPPQQEKEKAKGRRSDSLK